MTPLELAKQALEQWSAATPGPWEARWDGTLGRAEVRDGQRNPAHVLISVVRRGYGNIPPEGAAIAAARTREPQLAERIVDVANVVRHGLAMVEETGDYGYALDALRVIADSIGVAR